MILTRLSQYLQQHRRASVSDLVQGLGTTPDALRGMLATLERKGRVHRLPAGTACNGCCKCDPNTVELYEWTNPPAETTPARPSREANPACTTMT